MQIARRLTAELLGAALVQLFPNALLIEGGVTEFGFFYDFDLKQALDESFLPLLEEQMRAILKSAHAFQMNEMMRENAAAFLGHLNQPYIAERIRTAAENVVSVFQVGEFRDYFPYPGSVSKEQIAAFKLIEIAPLTETLNQSGTKVMEGSECHLRVLGIAAPTRQELVHDCKAFKQGKKRDHVLIGQQMQLFEWLPELSAYEWCWRPNGVTLRHLLLELWQKSYQQHGFLLLSTPSLLNASFMRQEERHALFKQGISALIEERDYFVPPSLSMAHAAMFRALSPEPDLLPVRYAECAKIAVPQKAGLWGILTSRLVYADAAHIFCTAEQLQQECISCLQFIQKIIKIFGFGHYWMLKGSSSSEIRFSKRQSFAEECLIAAVQASGQQWKREEIGTPSSADRRADKRSFAPELVLQMHLIDAVGREWAGPTIQLNFDLPEWLHLHSIRKGAKQPFDRRKGEALYMICQSVYGSLERWIALLIEHYAGVFPFWLMPEQGRVFPLHEAQKEYAEQVASNLRMEGFRFRVDAKPTALRDKVQEATEAKIPYLIVIGEEEEREQKLTVRIQKCIGEPTRGDIPGGIRQHVVLEDFLKQLREHLTFSK
jgi:threonyl-tRNA synthetase